MQPIHYTLIFNTLLVLAIVAAALALNNAWILWLVPVVLMLIQHQLGRFRDEDDDDDDEPPGAPMGFLAT